MKPLVLIILITSLFFQTYFAQYPNGENLKKIRADLQSKIKKNEIASLAIGVIKGGVFEQEQIARAVDLGVGIGSAVQIEIVTDDAPSADYARKIQAILKSEHLK